MGNTIEHASRTQGKPHAGTGQLLSVSTLFLSNLGCKFFKKRAIMSSLHSTEHMWAPQVASAVPQTHRWVAETWWDGQGLQPLGTLHSWWHRGGRVPRICSCVHPASHLLQELLLAWAAQPSLHWCSRWYLGTRQGKQLIKSFNFYDTKTANRVKGIRGTGPRINSTLQTGNKSPYECKTVTCTVTNTIIF